MDRVYENSLLGREVTLTEDYEDDRKGTVVGVYLSESGQNIGSVIVDLIMEDGCFEENIRAIMLIWS